MNTFCRLLLRAFIALVLLTLIATIAIGWLGSGHLVSPERRKLQSYHQEILAEPENYGLSITRYTGPQDTPCLLVGPAERPLGAAKSRALRDSLGQRNVPLPRWGEIRGTVVLLHGHKGRKEDHLPICERFCAAGFRCLLPDLPGHGDHPSGIATFGDREVQLVEELVDDARSCLSLPAEPTFLFGVSQGGAIALQTAAHDPDRWAGVISVASFAELDEVVRHSAERLHPSVRFAAPLTHLAVDCGTWCRAGYVSSDIRPIDAARRLTMPVMIVHGEDDTFVPVSNATRIFERIPAVRRSLRIVPGAGHGRVLAADADRLYPEMAAFLLEATLAEPWRSVPSATATATAAAATTTRAAAVR